MAAAGCENRGELAVACASHVVVVIESCVGMVAVTSNRGGTVAATCGRVDLGRVETVSGSARGMASVASGCGRAGASGARVASQVGRQVDR